jgi:hypothetical protein
MEYWNLGTPSAGVLERWSDAAGQLPITPLLHYCTIPIPHHSITPLVSWPCKI